MEINVNSFGIRPTVNEEAGFAFNKAIEEAKKAGKSVNLTLEKGIYNFYTENAITRKYFISNTSSETECPDKTPNTV